MEYNEPEKCDELSEMTLSALFKRGRAATGELKEMTGGKGRSIRWRIDKFLEPAGLVRDVDRREHPGNDERVYELTEGGQRYVSDNWAGLAHYAQRHEVLEASKETRNRIDDLHELHDVVVDRQDELESDFDEFQDEMEDDMNGFKGELHRAVGEVRNGVEEAEERAEKAERKCNRLHQRVQTLEEAVEEHEERLSITEQLAEEAWARMRDYEHKYDVRGFLSSANEAKTLVSKLSPLKDGERDWER